MLRTLTGMFGALAAGVVLGARVPIVLASRGDSMEVRMASCVLASLIAQGSKLPDAKSADGSTARDPAARVAA